METKIQTRRFLFVDILEVLAIFLVVTYHGKTISHDFLAGPSFTTYFHYFVQTIACAGVSIFFFVNGFLLFGKRLTLEKHIRKILSFVLITVFWAAIYVLSYFLIHNKPFSPGVSIIMMLNMDVQANINILWYMGTLTGIYLFFPALKSLYDSNFKAFALFTAACGVVTVGFGFVYELIELLTAILNLFFGITVRTNIIGYNFLENFNPFTGTYGFAYFHFCMGGIAFKYYDKIIDISARKRNTIAFVGLISACTMLFIWGVLRSYSDKEIYDVAFTQLNSLFAVIYIICLFVLSLNIKKESKILKLISSNTLGIYLLHILIIEMTKPYLMAMPHCANLPFTLVYGVFLVTLSLAIALLLKKIPYIRNFV